jgi:hypothetical protein
VGDVPDPRGGIRHVISGRGNYLLTLQPELPPLVDGQDRTLDLELLRCLRTEVFDPIDLVVSFIMKSSLAMVAGPLDVKRGPAPGSSPTTCRSPTPTRWLGCTTCPRRGVAAWRYGCSGTRPRASTRKPPCSGPPTAPRPGLQQSQRVDRRRQVLPEDDGSSAAAGYGEEHFARLR